jgi:hypothetical protein
VISSSERKHIPALTRGDSSVSRGIPRQQAAIMLHDAYRAGRVQRDPHMRGAYLIRSLLGRVDHLDCRCW